MKIIPIRLELKRDGMTDCHYFGVFFWKFLIAKFKLEFGSTEIIRIK